MDLLEPHITSGLGVSFRANNDAYWNVVGSRKIEAIKSYKDFSAKFTIEKIDQFHVYLKSSETKKYLSRVQSDDGVNFIEATEIKPSKLSKFEVLESDGKVVFKADNDRFVSRVYRNEYQNIEALKSILDEESKFIVEIGSLTRVKEEIENIDWGTLHAPPAGDVTPIVISRFVKRNDGAEELVKEFVFVKHMFGYE